MISTILRKLALRRYARELDANLAARKQARLSGEVYVSTHTRRAR